MDKNEIAQRMSEARPEQVVRIVRLADRLMDACHEGEHDPNAITEALAALDGALREIHLGSAKLADPRQLHRADHRRRRPQ